MINWFGGTHIRILISTIIYLELYGYICLIFTLAFWKIIVEVTWFLEDRAYICRPNDSVPGFTIN